MLRDLARGLVGHTGCVSGVGPRTWQSREATHVHRDGEPDVDDGVPPCCADAGDPARLECLCAVYVVASAAARALGPARHARQVADSQAPCMSCALTQNNKPYYIAGGTTIVVMWYVLSSYLNNKERLGSSVLRTVSHRVKDAPEVHALLGQPVQLKRSAFGDPWIEGIINPVKGKVDMSFQVQGPQGAATVYFTSVRKAKGEPFEVLRFLVVPDGDSTRAVSLLSGGSPQHVVV